MSAEAHRLIDRANVASLDATATAEAAFEWPANICADPARWLRYADRANAAALAHAAAEKAYAAAEQAARARAAELTATKKETQP